MADVHLGHEARISLSAYDVSRYGSLEGVVQNVASNTTEREGQPPFYENDYHGARSYFYENWPVR